MTIRSGQLAAAACVALSVFCRLAASAEPAAPASSRQQAASPLRPIELGDQVKVEVFDSPDLNTTTYVSDEGVIRLPLVGAVTVKGQSPAEAAERIEAALKDGQFLRDPHVTVTLVESFVATVTVVGEVAESGRYEIGPNFTVLDAIALAGGVTEKASDTAYVLRPDASGVVQRTPVTIDTSRLVAGAPPPSTAMQSLRGGDSVVVPKATFMISGEVQTPGEYRLESGMLLYQAIARAGGVTPLGSASRVDIDRRGPDGKTQKIKGRRDTPIQSDDVIRVKERLF